MTSTLPEWLRPPATTAPKRTIRVAFLGRTSTEEQQDPTLSIPRQLTNSERALLPNMVIVAWFWDVESSRKELSQRGRGTAWQKFDIAVQRDGGLADMLDEATSPDRRFDVVICESIDRIARWTHQGTKIEHDLELAGVPLLAADEPVMQSNSRKRAAQILLRRTKQGVAEWYMIEMLEKSWDGFEEHTTQGWNVGKPPYGYLAEKHKHPVPAKRAEGKHKTKLKIDPDRGPVVEHIYAWRIDEKLSYRAIAERLNTNLDRYPPPQPVDPARAVGRWTGSAVREILVNPKYTGHMVWNRRSTKDKLHPGKINPREQWVISAQPTHPGIVPIETFLAAQNVSRSRERSRADAHHGTLNRHRQTKRVYALRSYVWCAPCQRRMFGRTVTGYTYYSCQPRERAIPEGHPNMISVTGDVLLDAAERFFNTYVLGPDRVRLAEHSLDITAQQAADKQRRQIAVLQRTLDDITTRRRRLLRVIEENDDPDGTVFAEISERRAQLDRDREAKAAELAHLEETMPADPGSADILAALPEMEVKLSLLPTDRLRRLLDAFAVQIHHDVRTNQVAFRATVSQHAAPHLARLTRATADGPRPATHHHTSTNDAAPADDGGSDHLQFCDMPRRGHTTGPQTHGTTSRSLIVDPGVASKLGISRRPAGRAPVASPRASPAPGPPGWCGLRRPGRPGVAGPWASRPPTGPPMRPVRARSGP
ncbi:recombinase family protein [Salinispora arenicola]|nr:recombinase family protein [Salinispora arenicola]